MEYAVKKGDELILRARASIATQIRALITVEFRDDTLRTFPLQLKSTADRQAKDARSQAKMPLDGKVVGTSIEPLVSRERGEVFAQAWVAEKSTLIARNWLCSGYVHQARFLGLGDFEDPTAGQGFILRNPILDAVAVGADDLVNLTVPTNARWLVHYLFIEFIATSTAGTRTVLARLFTEDSEVMGTVWAAVNLTLSQTLRASIGVLDVELGGDVQVERVLQSPLPMREGMMLQILDTAGIDNADTVEFRGMIEEWIHD